MKKNKELPACGNPDCKCSTGIHEGLTFGSGKLDFNGFWEKPCRICAAHWDANIEQTRLEMQLELQETWGDKEGKEYVAESEWLYIPAWPFAEEKSDALLRYSILS